MEANIGSIEYPQSPGEGVTTTTPANTLAVQVETTSANPAPIKGNSVNFGIPTGVATISVAIGGKDQTIEVPTNSKNISVRFF
jgi:hypothetical protein